MYTSVRPYVLAALASLMFIRTSCEKHSLALEDTYSIEREIKSAGAADSAANDHELVISVEYKTAVIIRPEYALVELDFEHPDSLSQIEEDLDSVGEKNLMNRDSHLLSTTVSEPFPSRFGEIAFSGARELLPM
ncbi:MAG: hypothetical protein ACI959_001358 [Limisphaerales bacterium]|jgi:hypothetical protein